MTSGPGSVDLEGSSTSTLHVRHLDLGTYVFTLTVADTAGQTSSDDVTITVQPEMNEPPVARAGGNQTVRYPKKSVILDGSKSSDDYRLDSYQWSLIRCVYVCKRAGGEEERRERERERERERKGGGSGLQHDL